MSLLTANYHTHTYRCGHASGKDREYVEAAIAAGIETLGFSDHTPMLFPSGHRSGFRVQPEMTADYFESISRLRDEYKNEIRILIGVEAEYYPAIWEDYVKYLSDYPLDYRILGQHFLWDEETGGSSFKETDDPARLVSYYQNVLEGVDTGAFLYVAHPDVIHYVGPAEPYDEATLSFLTEIKKRDVPLEINRLGLYDRRNYPNPRFWELAGRVGIKAVVGLDAHSPNVFADEKSVAACFAIAEQNNLQVLKTLL